MSYFDIPGQAGIPSASVTECQLKCNNFVGCTNFVYVEQSCWLKNGFGEVTFREGYVWGPKNCGR